LILGLSVVSATASPVLALWDGDRERIAYHESGHVIVAIAEKLGLRYARIAPTAEVFANWQLNRVGGFCVESIVKFHIGGHAADKIFAPSLASRENSAYDFEQALRLVDPDHLERLLRETERRSSHIGAKSKP
jgi:hypothetical protein